MKMGPEQLAKILGAMGVKVDGRDTEDKRGAVRDLVAALSPDSARAVVLTGVLPGGEKIHALMVVTS
jgi:hypothetical protein